eukprot:262054-Amphidinium_carterae.1
MAIVECPLGKPQVFTQDSGGLESSISLGGSFAPLYTALHLVTSAVHLHLVTMPCLGSDAKRLKMISLRKTMRTTKPRKQSSLEPMPCHQKHHHFSNCASCDESLCMPSSSSLPTRMRGVLSILCVKDFYLQRHGLCCQLRGRGLT